MKNNIAIYLARIYNQKNSSNSEFNIETINNIKLRITKNLTLKLNLLVFVPLFNSLKLKNIYINLFLNYST